MPSPREEGRESEDQGGDWRDNPHHKGSREWFEFEDGRQEARREQGKSEEGNSGNPAW